MRLFVAQQLHAAYSAMARVRDYGVGEVGEDGGVMAATNVLGPV